MSVQALYIDRAGGPYPALLGVDNCWGVERDAKTYAGPHPGVYHPPCGPWGKLRMFCTKQDPTCGPRAVEQVRRFGGVLEHPAGSLLWPECGLPAPFGSVPMVAPGEWALRVDQCDWGHLAQKSTWLLFVGVNPANLPRLPPRGTWTHYIDTGKQHKNNPESTQRHLPKTLRHVTPPAFAEWLVACARSAT